LPIANDKETIMTSTAEMGGHKPLGNLAYDLVTVLHEKAKGLEAIDQYMDDAQNDEEARRLLERIRKEDEEQIEQIKRVVVRCLGGEAAGASEPIQTGSGAV
jgi:hypothetical protein